MTLFFEKFVESFICENNRDILEILQTQARDVYQEDFILTEIMMKKFYKLLDMQKSQSKAPRNLVVLL